MQIVEAEELTKKYDGNTVVDRLDLKIEEGEIFGFLGPNGAGKTTTILMLLGLTEPSGGIARVAGFNATREPLKVKRITGYVAEKVGFYEDLPAVYNLLYTTRLNKIPDDVAQKKIKEALGVVGLSKVAEQNVKTFSRGMRQRLAIADVLVKEPKIAILDEPTSGIDPEGVGQMLSLIKGIARDRNMTIIFSSHQLNQVQKICSRVGIMNEGRLVAEGPVEELGEKALSGGKFTIEIQLTEITGAIMDAIRKVDGVVAVERVGELLLVGCNEDVRPKIAKAIVESNGSLVNMKIQSYALEDIYLKYFRGG
jgi:ABC-2 type transport system ATP-binding protein